MNKPLFIDLFAGAGGLSEGFLKAGFKSIAHIEIDKNACDTIQTRTAYHFLKSNKRLHIYYDYLRGEISNLQLLSEIPSSHKTSVINQSIADETINSLFDIIEKKLKGRTLDFIVGGPPCQAYSLLGRHHDDIEKDPRNKLYIQYGRFLKKFKPKGFVFENVPGILSANNGKHFLNLKKYFRKIGYEVYPKKINASDFNVIQARNRIIIIGWKKENDFGFPTFKTKKIENISFDLLQDLPELEPGNKPKISHYTNYGNNYLNKFKIKNGVDFVTQHHARNHNSNDLKIYKIAIDNWTKEKKRLKYTDIPSHLQSHKNKSSFLDRYKVVNGTGLSHTVVAHIAKDGHYYIHPDPQQCRSISVREAARIQSFSDDYFFEGSRTSMFKQIGNAVPPLMSEKIAKKLKKLIWQ